jgi:hypothetical protein
MKVLNQITFCACIVNEGFESDYFLCLHLQLLANRRLGITIFPFDNIYI